MKKIFFTLCIAGAGFGLSAQSAFVVSPGFMEDGEVLALLGERMSANQQFVAGSNQMLQVPALWNTVTDELVMIVESDTAIFDDGEGGTIESTEQKTGAFHAVNNDGLAVGELVGADYVSHAILYNSAEGSYTILSEQPEDAGNSAYSITADGQVIVGYHFDADWVTHACVWTDGGKTRTDLAWPNEEELGFKFDYASARMISADGSVIAGYAQDWNSGSWVALTWTLENGEYVPQVISTPYYQPLEWNDNGPVIPAEPKPFQQFEPLQISANGEWLSLIVKAFSDPTDWDNMPYIQAARLNLKSGLLEVLDNNGEQEGPEMFGIANDGTSVGRMNGEFDFETWSQPVEGVIWKAGETQLTKLTDVFPDDDYLTFQTSYALCDISADGHYLLGYAQDEEFDQTTFIAEVPGFEVAIERVELQHGDAVAYDLNGRKASADAKGLVIVNGVKSIRR